MSDNFSIHTARYCCKMVNVSSRQSGLNEGVQSRVNTQLNRANRESESSYRANRRDSTALKAQVEVTLGFSSSERSHTQQDPQGMRETIARRTRMHTVPSGCASLLTTAQRREVGLLSPTPTKERRIQK